MKELELIEKARELLGLGEYASLEEIKAVYRSLCLKYHPDHCDEEEKAECEKKFKEINRARDILLKYCSGYRYSFKKEDIRRNIMGKEYAGFERFYSALWGDLNL
jgi:DnaJ-class molecular chaperone